MDQDPGYSIMEDLKFTSRNLWTIRGGEIGIFSTVKETAELASETKWNFETALGREGSSCFGSSTPMMMRKIMCSRYR